MRRIIQVGVGGMGQVWTRAVAESASWEAAAYVDVSHANLMAAAEAHGMPIERCFSDVNTALSTVEADALLDVTPQQYRLDICREALRHDCDVLCEKPLADTVKNARSLLKAVEQSGRRLMVAQNYRYQALMQTARQYIQRGKLGDLGYVRIDFFKGPRFGGYREEMDYPLILDMSIHHFDLLRYLLDTDIRRLRGLSMNAPWNWNQGDASVFLHLELANGVTAAYNASWVSPGWETPWNGHWRIEGSEGVLLIEQDRLFFANKPDSRRELTLRKFTREHQDWLLEAFYDCLDKGAEPETSGRRNINSFAATHAAVKAVQSGRSVNVAG